MPQSYIDKANGALTTQGASEALRVDVASPTITYVGKAPLSSSTVSSVWRIQRLTTGATGSVTVEWADGNSLYDNVWDNRASLTYL